MGLLSDYADANGGMPGLLGWTAPTDASLAPQTSSPDFAALLAQLGIADTSGAAFGGPPMQTGGSPLDPSASAPLGQGATFTGQGQPPSSQDQPPVAGPPQLAPTMPPEAGAGSPHPGGGVGSYLSSLLSGVGHTIQNAVSLPGNILGAYAAGYGAVPQNVAFQQAQHALALRSAMQGQALIGSLLGNGGGGLFGGGSPAPSAQGLLPGAQPSPGLLPPSTAPSPGPISAPPSAATPLSQGVVPPPPGQSGSQSFASPANQDTRPEGAAGPNPDAPSSSPPPPQLPQGIGGFDIRNPNTQKVIAALDLMGNPAGANLTTLGTAVMPKYEALRPGGFMTVNGQVTGASAPDNGTYNIPDGKGGYINVPVPNSATNTAAYEGAVAGGKAAGDAVGKLPYAAALAQANASGTAAGEAPYQMVKVNLPDGSTQQMTLAQFKIAQANGATLAVGLGHSQSPAAATFATGQAGGLNEAITADQSARQAAMQTHDAAARAVSIASTLPFNPAAPTLYQARKLASVLGVPSKEMDSAATYNQLSTQAILTYARGSLPSRYTQNELALVKPVIGSIKDPNSAALMAAGLQAAISNKAIARANYADAYNPSQSGVSRQQYEAGWAQTPAGRASLFADPVWGNVKIGGQPAVSRFTGPNGKPYLAVTPGLGKATYLPVN